MLGSFVASSFLVEYSFRSAGCGSPFTVSPVAGISVSTVFAYA